MQLNSTCRPQNPQAEFLEENLTESNQQLL